MRKPITVGLVSAFLLALLLPVGTTAATNPWTTARVQKAIAAKVRIKRPSALVHKFSLGARLWLPRRHYEGGAGTLR